ncbi:HDOD domain-containing protein [Noviherbaspirillum aridicola]|uniref:HDOD domain-containing protein n=1 Tax=Noviherbaspirillum aridicola TaxID=2849687 RepID=A0ABQ4Q9Y9_9BURK|nr:HDOD domain-containing protein [Noviherbaspirillum aridicola]GIZ54023.1 HDOD domain-containing protein [Noviherbaspirillum aridicola]
MVSQHAGPASPAGARTPADEAARIARDRLLQKISSEADLPALGGAVSRVVQMTSSDDEAVRSLARFILSDVALTQKVLRLANTVTYRTASGTPVTTVSKAIFILGFETVKTAALAMILVDGLAGRHAKAVYNELNQALCASIVGREMARRSQFKDAEEAAIAALFKNIGRVLVAAHDPHSYNRISALAEAGDHTPAQASIEVLGCSFELLAEAVLREWNMPETIVSALASPPPGVLKPPKGRQEWMQQVAAFSAAAARLIPQHGEQGQEAAARAVLTRFGGALGLDHARMSEMFADVAEETRNLATNVDLALNDEHVEREPHAQAADDAARASGLPGELLLGGADQEPSPDDVPRHASGKPINARDRLLAGVQDVTQMMASGRCKVNDLMLLVLETLYSGLGFRFATVCLKDPQNQGFRARIAIGEQAAERQAKFAFPASSSRDLFLLALENDADLMISDAGVPKIRDLLPAWHRALLPDARSFIVLPLVVQKRQLGFFYADRVQPAPEGVPHDETALIKTLKGQVLAAVQPR